MDRSITVAVPGRPTSLNFERTKHWSDRAARVAQVRHDAKYAALGVVGVGRRGFLFERVTVEVYPWVKNRRYRTDVGNVYPTYKAALDGLVDARIVEDDDDTHVLAVTFYPCQYGVDQIVLTVTEVPKGGEADEANAS